MPEARDALQIAIGNNGYRWRSPYSSSPSACRPRSVIASRSRLSVRPPAFTISGLAVAKPARTILASCLTVNPCARNVASVHPCGAGQELERPVLRGVPPDLSWFHRHRTPVRLSRGGCSCQFGRASAPTMPQRVHTMRGPNVGTGTSSDHGSALMIARWWHCQHVTSSDRTPLARMLPRVIGSIGSVNRAALI